MQQFADVRGPHTASFVTLTALLERKFLKVPIYRLQIFGVITAERAAMANTCSKNTCLGQLKSFWKSSRGVARSAPRRIRNSDGSLPPPWGGGWARRILSAAILTICSHAFCGKPKEDKRRENEFSKKREAFHVPPTPRGACREKIACKKTFFEKHFEKCC